MARSKGIARRSSGKTTTPKWATSPTFVFQPSPAWIPNVPFRFLHLPSEIRLSIYEYIIPHGLEIDLSCKATRRTSENSTGIVARWRPLIITNPSAKPDSWMVKGLISNGASSLFLVSKFVSNEARAVLYGSNTFMINIDAEPRDTASLSTPEIFGPLGLPERLHLLRDLRSISLTLTPTRHSLYWAHRRHRGRLARFVEIMREYGEDAEKGCLLESLSVHLEEGGRSQFALEALTPLRGIKNVCISGSVSPWFAECLTLSVRGAGGEVRKAVYEEAEVKKRIGTPGNRKWKKMTVSTQQWYMPEMDWIPFALENEIDLPEDVQRFWENEKQEDASTVKGKDRPVRPPQAMRIGYREEGWVPDWGYQTTHGHPLDY